MSISIFDLYSHHRQPVVPHRGPYEFPNRKQKKQPICTSDSFRWEESPERKENPSDLPPADFHMSINPSLGDYQQYHRRVSQGTISVIRRKELPPAKSLSLPTNSMPRLADHIKEKPIQGQTFLQSIKPKLKDAPTHSYMQNRQYWDGVNSMIQANRVPRKPRAVFRKSLTLSGVNPLRRTMTMVSIGKAGKEEKGKLVRSATKYWAGVASGKGGQNKTGKASVPPVNGTFTEYTDLQEVEEWKSNIRERAAALVHTLKGMPRPKRYMGAPLDH